MIEVRQFDQYVVRVDGSGRVTLRNRKFLRKYTPAVIDRELPLSTSNHQVSLPIVSTATARQPAALSNQVTTRVPTAVHGSSPCFEPPIDAPVPESEPTRPMADCSNGQQSCMVSKAAPVPRALSRLFAHNKPGTQEQNNDIPVMPNNSQRCLRSNTKNSALQ